MGSQSLVRAAGSGLRLAMTRSLVLAVALTSTGAVAKAERISNPIAVFAGLDKITGITTTFEIPIAKEMQFGALIVKPNVCYTRPLTEEPKTTSFVEVDQVMLDNSRKRLFSGWMFAESPGLSGVEHAIYDVWLTGCRDPNAPPPVVEAPPEPAPDTQAKEDESPDD